jgi:CHAT domain-containing protein
VTDGAFTSERAVLALTGHHPVHLATHVARADTRATVAPVGLVTSGGGFLSADEIARCAPRLPLLVLAACGSADGETIDGLGARGLAQAALDGGTRAAVVTLWPIADAAGRVASVAFHAALLDGASPAEALRRARSALERAGAPPSEWAAHRLLGRS